MRRPFSEVIEEGAALGYSLRLLDEEVKVRLKGLLAVHYGLNDREYHSNRLGKYYSVHDPDAWRWLDEFTARGEAVLFFDEDEDRGMVLFDQGISIVEVLGECTGFVFYLTSLQASYVICFNDHDVIIAAGEAEEWLKRKKPLLE